MNRYLNSNSLTAFSLGNFDQLSSLLALFAYDDFMICSRLPLVPIIDDVFSRFLGNQVTVLPPHVFDDLVSLTFLFVFLQEVLQPKICVDSTFGCSFGAYDVLT